MKVNKLLDKYKFKYIPGNLKPNYIKLPKNYLNADSNGMNIFNEIYREILKEDYFEIVRTPSGGISIKNKNLFFPAYDIKANKNGVEITILTADAMCRVIFSAILNRTEDEHKITGTQAFRLFKSTLEKYNINIDDYMISEKEGLEEKKQIKYCKKLADNCFKDLTFENVHHIDYNSSYPAGLVNTHPEFKEAIEYLFEKRHESKIYKEILNNSISGYFQSKYVKYGLSKLCKDAINDNFKRLGELTVKLEKAGCVPLLYNSDGIWYIGKTMYHDENEGTKLGQWKHDYVNCKFRAKSAAAYEFIDKDGYHPKMSGRTKLDRIKPRSDWEWGDIYNKDCVEIKYTFKLGVGIYEK